MAKRDQVPTIAGLIAQKPGAAKAPPDSNQATKQSSTGSSNTDTKVESYKDSKVEKNQSTETAENHPDRPAMSAGAVSIPGAVQLNARIPRDLNAQLVEAQGKLAARLPRKPKLQDLVTACLRMGLSDVEALARALDANDGDW